MALAESYLARRRAEGDPGRWEMEIGTSTDERDANAIFVAACLVGSGAFI
jgi:hypothetical protein